MSEEIKLKPCPFCGGDNVSKVTEGEPGHENSWIHCHNCNATAEDEKIWNSRPKTLGRSEIIETLKEVVKTNIIASDWDTTKAVFFNDEALGVIADALIKAGGICGGWVSADDILDVIDKALGQFGLGTKMTSSEIDKCREAINSKLSNQKGE